MEVSRQALWSLALVLCVLCGASPEVHTLQDVGALDVAGATLRSSLPDAVVAQEGAAQEVSARAQDILKGQAGGGGDQMGELKKSVADAVAEAGGQSAAEAAEQAAQKVLHTPSKEDLIAQKKKLPLLERIQSYVKAYLSSPKVLELIHSEFQKFQAEQAAALALKSEQLEKPMTPEEATRDAVEKEIKKMMDTPEMKEKSQALEKEALDKEVQRVEAKTGIIKKQAEVIEKAAEEKVKSAETKAEKKASVAAEKVETLSAAASALSGAGKKKILGRIDRAKAAKKEADKKKKEVKEQKAQLKQEEEAEEKVEAAKAKKAIETTLKDQVGQEVQTKLQLEADKAADSKVQEIADTIKKGVERAEQRAALEAKKKEMMKPKAPDINEDRYWQRRRRFAAQKSQVMGQLDAWKSPEQAKKEADAKAKDEAEEAKAGKAKEAEEKAKAAVLEKQKKDKAGREALNAELQKKLTPSLLNSVAKASIEGAEVAADSEKESAEEEVEVLDSKKEEMEALAKATQTRIDDAIDRVAQNRAAVKVAVSVAEAKAARQGIERAQKDLKKDEGQKKIQKEKLDNIKKEEGEAKLDAEAEEKKKEDPKVAKKLANVPAEVVISAAQDVANKVLKKPENKTPEAGGDEPAQQAVMTQEQKMANEKEVVKTTEDSLEQKRKETGRAELEVQHAQNNVNAVIEDNKAKARARKHATGLQQDARDQMLAEAAEQAVIPSNVNA